MAVITEAKLIKVLQTYNPWWKNPESIRPMSRLHKRVAYHEALKVIQHPTIRRYAVLSGARRVGKTTILYQMIEQMIDKDIYTKNILYVSFDNPIIKMLSIDDVISIYESVYPADEKKFFFFDEIQYTSNWELWMKTIYDTRPDIVVTATGSASPVLDIGTSDSGTGRWSTLRVPTLSFYEYCDLLELKDRPHLPNDLHPSSLISMGSGEIADLMHQFSPLLQHFNRYLTIGGFPELILSDDDTYAHRMLREDVVDKVIKRDVLTLFNVRNPLSMEKLFLYLCMTSSEIFNKQVAARELGNISVSAIEDYISFLTKSNLIHVSSPVMVGSKSALKGRPKIYIADAAIRSAVLMLEDVVTDDIEMGVMVETTVYKHIVSFYQNAPSVRIGYYRKAKDNQKEVDVVVELPKGKILCEVKYRNDTSITASDAIIELSKEDGTNITDSFIITKSLVDYGVSRHETKIPVFRIPALVFVYMLGSAEAIGDSRKM